MDEFVDWYNHEHRHSGIGLHTAADVFYGLAGEKDTQRRAVLADAPSALPPPLQQRHRTQDHRPTRDRRDQPAQANRTGAPCDSRLTPRGLKHLDKFRPGPDDSLTSLIR